MDIDTESVVIRRDRKTAVLNGDMLRALALTAVKNAIDPENKVTFDAQTATIGDDGSITVSLLVETEVPAAPTAPTASAVPAPTAATAIPMTIGTAQTA